jgi:hypothetical protein
MGITKYGLEFMGFTQIPESDSVCGVFNKLYVFHVEGIVLEDDTSTSKTGIINGKAYQIAFGAKLNAICNELVADDFIDDEEKWVTDNKTSAPFAVIRLGPTSEHVSTSRYAIETDDGLHIYDGFASARQEIAVTESRVIPALIAALELTFSGDGHRVRFCPVAETFYGISPGGKTLRDVNISVNGSMTSSRKLGVDEFDTNLANALQFAARLNPRVANFMHMGFLEKDRLKKFLNFFLSIEIETHATFKSIEHSKFLSDIIVQPADKIKATVNSLFIAQHNKLNSLKEHFIWCVMCKWKHLSDLDVETFSRLKKIRDDIAHGNISVLPAGAEHDAENFVIKIHAQLQALP